jgi:uncharacterized protein (DUF433 family)
MAVIQKSLRIQEKILKEIERIAEEAQKDFSRVTNELLEEAVKAHRCPGVVFTEGARGRRARVAGTGIEVWEIIAAYQSVGKNLNRLKRAYHWLSASQLQAALGYYKAYPEEIDRLIAANENQTPERVHERHPVLTSSRG